MFSNNSTKYLLNAKFWFSKYQSTTIQQLGFNATHNVDQFQNVKMPVPTETASSYSSQTWQPSQVPPSSYSAQGFTQSRIFGPFKII